jgi:hypothetical protein
MSAMTTLPLDPFCSAYAAQVLRAQQSAKTYDVGAAAKQGSGKRKPG